MNEEEYLGKIRFLLRDNRFYHNHEVDFGYFALWKVAIPFRQEIIQYLSKRFEIVMVAEIEWSKENFHSNANRLYEVPILFSNKKESITSPHATKIGTNHFPIVVVKDNNPDYTFAQSVSGKVELSNLNIVSAKYEFRKWIEAKNGVKYGVHSTNNIEEFYFQMPLLIGVKLFKQIISGKIFSDVLKLKRDLEGAAGWKNYQHLFEILNLSTKYLVQRSFETLPGSNPEKDIDFLTDNFQRLASTLCAKQLEERLYKGRIIVGGEIISIDIRFVGDDYYDSVWEMKMLERKILQAGVYVPRKDDYFFSLLYHCRVQKGDIKEKYIEILDKLADDMKFNWYTTEKLKSDEKIGKILKGYLSGEGYFYKTPIDKGVYHNNKVINFLPTLETSLPRFLGFRRKSIKLIKRILPKRIKLLIKKYI